MRYSAIAVAAREVASGYAASSVMAAAQEQEPGEPVGAAQLCVTAMRHSAVVVVAVNQLVDV
jgi:hypothetical protein